MWRTAGMDRTASSAIPPAATAAGASWMTPAGDSSLAGSPAAAGEEGLPQATSRRAQRAKGVGFLNSVSSYCSPSFSVFAGDVQIGQGDSAKIQGLPVFEAGFSQGPVEVQQA